MSTPATGLVYTPRQRMLQDGFDTRRIADRISTLLVHDTVTADDRNFIESRDMVFVATVDEHGQPTCSYKGGEPGFVTVVDDRTLAMPSYDGNGMFLTLGNVANAGAAQPAPIGLLFIDFEGGSRMRIHGTASASTEDPLLGRWPGAQVAVRVRVSQVFPNCGRYVHHYQLVERSTFVPRSDRITPVPSWKCADWARDALPVDDPAGEPGHRPVRWR
jgi:uncharacterized protein